ncbi:ATP synthase-coupling factor 6, mitochondrial-like [Rhodnius prolixus]|uniref:ATP synthase-coupling factor 6, mitochondrial n=2 Tax=Rhodnius TaxID=13248 RepID=R4FLH7_RHOPR
MSLRVSRLVKNVGTVLSEQSRRNLGVSAPILQKVSDPIQQLFLDKLREYKQKSSGGKLVDPSPETERELKQELLKLAKQFGGKEGVDMTKFPDFKFLDAKLDPINLEE